MKIACIEGAQNCTKVQCDTKLDTTSTIVFLLKTQIKIVCWSLEVSVSPFTVPLGFVNSDSGAEQMVTSNKWRLIVTSNKCQLAKRETHDLAA